MTARRSRQRRRGGGPSVAISDLPAVPAISPGEVAVVDRLWAEIEAALEEVTRDPPVPAPEKQGGAT